MSNFFFAFINKIIELIGGIITVILALLPTSPFQFVANLPQDWFKFINWLIPIDQAILHLEVYIVAVGIYYGIRVVLRWIKVAGS